MVELNKKYSGKELAEQLFDISAGTFRNQKQKYLDYMSEFYEWHMEGTKYVLTKEIKEYINKPIKIFLFVIVWENFYSR